MIIKFDRKFTGKEIFDAFFVAFKSEREECRWEFGETVTNFGADMVEGKLSHVGQRTVILSSHVQIFRRRWFFKQWVDDGVSFVTQEIDLQAQYTEIKVEIRAGYNFCEGDIFASKVIHDILFPYWGMLFEMASSLCEILVKRSNKSEVR